ncbi:hypothetical protein N7481_008724 [Penicillium waksmanii]|uniref:uncharacterized protein n=1 Tax=Penicillium waksmanii TaxID=69791 RepID=UPI00254751FF|nr:uncharacterized protein N7481_008724 [Penicillium waksmanii]KAJ5975017.1 hypothetical protein N7481_008724 [Penicillium waksmanii]
MLRSRIGVLQTVANVQQLCLRCLSRQRQSSCLSLRTRHAPRPIGRRLLSTTRILRAIPTETTKQDQIADTNSAEPNSSSNEAFSQAELETYRDIREYLHKWQATNPLVLDPVRDAGIGISTDSPGQGVLGSMLNGRESSESLWANSNLKQEDDFDTSEECEGEHLEPGDMVARLTTDGVFIFAIYVRSVHRQKQFYTSRGNWRVCTNREVDFVFKDFAPPELLDPIIPYFPDGLTEVNSEIQSVPEGGLPRPLGAPLVNMMNNFEEHLLSFYRDHSKVLDSLHELVADDSEFQRLTLEDLTMKALSIDESELTPINMFNVHQAVRRHPFKIEKDIPSFFSRTYLIQPMRIAKVVDQVIDWVREHQDFCIRAVMSKEQPGRKDHPMHQFIQKSQRMIRLSRKVRSPTIMSSVGPSSQQFIPGDDGKSMMFREVLTERFTANDQTILEFMQYYAIPSVIMPSGALRSAASHIMRATGMYNTLGLSEASTRLFLQELGVISPWENLGVLDQSLLLPGHGMSLLEDMKWEEVEESCKSIPLEDSMQNLRKDWGDLPVYCVDDVSAQEIDDGVSLERIPGSDDMFWVHIHVANPTAFLDRGHPIIDYAASRVATTYVPERTYPILPTALTQDHFSLAAGRPTLTFSAKMNLQGEILETEVVNGTIRNVISITHSTLSKFLNGSTESADYLAVGDKSTWSSPPTAQTSRQTLTAEDKESFTTLQKLMQGFRTQRQKNGAMDLQPSHPGPSLSLQIGTAPFKPYEMQVTEGRYYVGDPKIKLRMQDFNPHDVRDESKHYLISLLMNLAGHISGRFCADRNIPVVFNGTWYDPEYQRVTRDNVAEFGGQAFYRLAMPKSLARSSPVQHHIMGLDSYVKCTSPLRRFTDVIAHYQIEAALRFENEFGRRFDGRVDLPEEIATEAEQIESESESSSPSSSPPHTQQQTWTSFYFGECELPTTFPVLLRAKRLTLERDGLKYSGVISNLGVNCTVSIPADCPGVENMDVFGIVEARVVGVDMSKLDVEMECVGFIKAFERVGEWA